MSACVFQYYCSASHVQASTSFQQEEFTFTWHINEAKLFLQEIRDQKVWSPAFTVHKIPCNFFLNASMRSLHHYRGVYDNLGPPKSVVKEWYELSLQLECEKDTFLDNANYRSCSRIMFQSSNYKVLASKFSFSVLDHLNVFQAGKTLVNTWFISDGRFKNISDIIKIEAEKFDQCLHSGTLTVQVNAILKFFSNPIESVSKFSIASEPNPNIAMKVLLEEGIFSDVTIRTSTKTFNVHRAVLASHSDVFKRMFEINMREKQEGIVTIPDIEPEVMTELLTYMYTGCAPDLKTHAKEFLLTADKYNISHLQVLCENELKTNLTPANVVEILLIADKCQFKGSSSESLKDVCTKFIKHNPSVYQLDSWKTLKGNCLHLALEIMEFCV